MSKIFKDLFWGTSARLPGTSKNVSGTELVHEFLSICPFVHLKKKIINQHTLDLFSVHINNICLEDAPIQNASKKNYLS